MAMSELTLTILPTNSTVIGLEDIPIEIEGETERKIEQF